jgi:hypothetical protein
MRCSGTDRNSGKTLNPSGRPAVRKEWILRDNGAYNRLWLAENIFD